MNACRLTVSQAGRHTMNKRTMRAHNETIIIITIIFEAGYIGVNAPN